MLIHLGNEKLSGLYPVVQTFLHAIAASELRRERGDARFRKRKEETFPF